VGHPPSAPKGPELGRAVNNFFRRAVVLSSREEVSHELRDFRKSRFGHSGFA
jgi:hypothetical protein